MRNPTLVSVFVALLGASALAQPAGDPKPPAAGAPTTPAPTTPPSGPTAPGPTAPGPTAGPTAPAPTGPIAPLPPPPSTGGTSTYVSPVPTTADPKADAKAHYEVGLTHYNLGEFEPAIVEFKAAYALSNAPGLLFNIAQSYRLKKDFEQASYFYKTYLRLKADAPNRDDVEARIKEMDDSLAAQKAAAISPPTGTVSPDGNTRSTDTRPTGDLKPTSQPAGSVGSVGGVSDHVVRHGDGKSLMTAGIATAGAGGALILTGLVFGHLASSAEGDLNALNAGGGTWTQADQDKYDSGKRDNTIAVITFIAGGAALATGGTLWVLGYLKENKATVAMVPTKGGAAFAAGWSF
jgi:hypothetical protein